MVHNCEAGLVATNELWRERLTTPAYRVGEAASYVRISPQTITHWERQRNSNQSVVGRREKKAGLSFLQLIEVAVVAAMRDLGVKLPEIRHARSYLSKRLDLKYPFAQIKFKSDGVDVLLDLASEEADKIKDKLLTANRSGQYIWSGVLSNRLREFNYGPDGNVDLWKVNGEDSLIEISPRIAFGAPSINGVATAAIKQRWADGYSIDDIGDDLGLMPQCVEEALRFEGMEIDRERKNFWIN